MNSKRLWVLGAVALAAAVAGAAVVMHQPGLGHSLHHGGSQPPLAGNSAVHKAREGVAALGKHWDASVRDATTALYADLLSDQGSAGIREIEHLNYGPDDRQRLEVFVPEGGFNELTTVVVYLHGDGVSQSEPSNAGLNVGRFAATVGAIGVNAGYREVTATQPLAGAEDVRLVLEWVRANIEPLGGNPNNIVLMGNSTGAARIATYLFHEPSQLPDGPGVTAAILSSGTFGADAQSGATPLALVDGYTGRAVPLLLWSAEYDVPAVETSVAELYAKLCRKYAACPMFVQLQGFNHLSHVLSIGTADTTVTNAIMRFYHSVIDAH